MKKVKPRKFNKLRKSLKILKRRMGRVKKRRKKKKSKKMIIMGITMEAITTKKKKMTCQKMSIMMATTMMRVFGSTPQKLRMKTVYKSKMISIITMKMMITMASKIKRLTKISKFQVMRATVSMVT